jgi:hypothetical protein
LFKKIAETSVPKFKLELLSTLARAIRPPPRKTFPAGRRTKLRAGFPVCAKLIVLFAIGRVAQDLVGLVDLLKLFFCLFLVLGDIGMIFAREFPKSLLDVGITRVTRHAENLIVVSILNRHKFRAAIPLSRRLGMMLDASDLSKADKDCSFICSASILKPRRK